MLSLGILVTNIATGCILGSIFVGICNKLKSFSEVEWAAEPREPGRYPAIIFSKIKSQYDLLYKIPLSPYGDSPVKIVNWFLDKNPDKKLWDWYQMEPGERVLCRSEYWDSLGENR